METISDYTSNPDYMKTWYELMEQQDKFMEVIQDSSKPAKVNLNGLGEVEVGHLRQYSTMVEQAFDMRMRLTAYWKVVVMRLVDELALHILHSLKVLVEDELESAMVNEIVGSRASGIEKMLEETPSTAGKRDRLGKSIVLLKESKQVVADLMDRIGSLGD